jgi:predicted ABC-type ATPase
MRVAEGGQYIPSDFFERRYSSGIENLFKIHIPLCNEWLLFDNSNNQLEEIANGKFEAFVEILNINKFDKIKRFCFRKRKNCTV